MKKLLFLGSNVFTFYFIILFFISCSGNPAQKNKLLSRESIKTAKWDNPQKGKIFSDQEGFMIPLTAIEYHILGTVKSVTYQDYKFKNGTAIFLNDSGYNVYNKDGYLITQSEYKGDGRPIFKCTYMYDSNNKLVEMNFNFIESKQYLKKRLQYDNEGKKISDSSFNEKMNFIAMNTYKYDSKGYQIEKKSYKPNATNIIVENSKYNDSGYQTEYKLISTDGKLDLKIIAEYNNNGNLINSISYHSDTIIEERYKAVYDDKQRKIEGYIYNNDGTIRFQLKYKYDDYDNLIEEINYKSNDLVDTSKSNFFKEYQYDSKGNVIKLTQYKLKSGKKVMTDVSKKTYMYY